MSIFLPEQIDYLAQGLAKTLKRPGTPGEIVFLRCLDEADIVLLCSSSNFKVNGWEILGVTVQADDLQRRITADQAVEIRENKGAPHIFLIDYLHAGAGLDGIYNACREVTEEQFYEEAVKLLRKKMRGWTKFADDAMIKAQRLNARTRLSPRQRFEFQAAFVLGRDKGASLATLGLWPVKLGSHPNDEDLTNSARLVEKLLLVNTNKLTPAERVRSLLLDPETPVKVRSQLEEFTENASSCNARDVVRDLAGRPELWLNAIRPAFGSNKLRELAIEAWRSPKGALYKWSGLIAVGDGVPEFRINDDSKLDVRWRVTPEELPAGTVEYQIAIRSGEHEIAAQVQSHAGKPQQTCRFSKEDFADLDEQGRYEAEVIVTVLGDTQVGTQSTEPFQIVFGDRPEPTTSSISGITVRALVDGAIQCDTLEEFEEACAPARLDASGKDAISFRPIRSGRGFRIHRPPLLRQVEKSWFTDSSTICRWKARILDDGSVVGDLERIPLVVDVAEDEGKKLLAAVGKFAKFTEAATAGLGLVARIYGPAEKATEDYLREWANTLSSGDPKLALAYTVEVESLSGDTIGLIVLPMHPLRVAWHVGYDLLAKHTRYTMNEPLKTIKRVLARLDSASFPMMLPGIKNGETFIYGDTLGTVTGGKSGNSFHAVAMVRANDREPRAAVALVAQCYLGENQNSVSPGGNRAADLLAKEIERYRAYHTRERPKFLHIHGLRPGDGSILAGALGKFLGTEQDSEDASRDRSFGYVLRLHPSTDSSTVTGRFLTHLNEQRRSGSKTIPAEYRWIHDSFSLNEQQRLPRLRWYKATKEPKEYAHLSIAFDTFETNVVAFSEGDLVQFAGKQLRHGYGLICCPARYWSFHPPRSQVLPPRAFEGKVHPHHRNVTERLEKLQYAVATAVARQLNPTSVWPVMQAQLSDEHERELEVVHRLSDWVITLDRHAAVEYFDSPKEAGKIYDSYVIDCQPERDDLGSLQMITSTANLQEVRQLLDRSLAEMGLSSSRQNCEFLLRQLKALSGRLAIRLVSDATQQEIISLAMVYAQSCKAKSDDPIWPPLTDGFFLPLDDLRDLIPHADEAGENEQEEMESRAESRADLVYVTTLKKGPGLEFRFIEVKYRRTLMSARAGILISRINSQIDQTADRWQTEFNGEGLSPFFQRSRLYRALRFYADKARRHDLGEPAYLRIQTQLERLLTDEKVPFAIEVSKHRGFIFCPDYRGELPDELQKSPGIYLFGPHPLPDLQGLGPAGRPPAPRPSGPPARDPNSPLEVDDAPDEKEIGAETPNASYTQPVDATTLPIGVQALDTDVVAQIANLQAEYQNIADKHDWVCLFVPSLDSGKRKIGPVVLGELSWPSAPGADPRDHGIPRILDERGSPLGPSGPVVAKSFQDWNKKLDEYSGTLCPGLGGVKTPANPRKRAVTDYVSILTDKSRRLVLRVLNVQNEIPADIQQEIRAWEAERYGYGWFRWIWYAAPIRHANLCQNYPQVAVTALSVLQDYCRASEAVKPPPEPPSQGGPTGLTNEPLPPEDPEQSVRREGANWIITYGNEKATFPAKDFSAIEVLLKLLVQPNENVELKDLLDAETRILLEQPGADVLDDTALANYRTRLGDLTNEQRAETNPLVRAENDKEIKEISAAIKRHVGPGNRKRALGATAVDRAWDALTRNLRRLWPRLRDCGMPELAEHFANAIKCERPIVIYCQAQGVTAWSVKFSSEIV